ncbi:MAG: hypothetical protein V4685_17890 [Bacteroidota bacterium]
MKYKTFLWIFILSMISGIIFLIFYLQAIFSVVKYSAYNPEPDPFSIFEKLFTPVVIISFIVMVATSLTYRIMGIVAVAKNKVASGGEKALWIVGFVLLGFITGIAFLALAKGRKLVEQETETSYTT